VGERLMVQAHGQVQTALEVMREMQERGGRIRTHLRCSTKCWQQEKEKLCRTPSGGCCDGVQGDGAQVRRDKAEANAGPADEEEEK
jgi:hypothetical protein